MLGWSSSGRVCYILRLANAFVVSTNYRLVSFLSRRGDPLLVWRFLHSTSLCVLTHTSFLRLSRSIASSLSRRTRRLRFLRLGLRSCCAALAYVGWRQPSSCCTAKRAFFSALTFSVAVASSFCVSRFPGSDRTACGFLLPGSGRGSRSRCVLCPASAFFCQHWPSKRKPSGSTTRLLHRLALSSGDQLLGCRCCSSSPDD